MALTPRENLDAVAELARGKGFKQLADDVNRIGAQHEELVAIAALVSTAAAKHTGGMARVRSEQLGATTKRQFDRNAVGRLHNAAARARAILNAGACLMCSDRHEAGVKPEDSSGTCGECGRGLGRLEDSRKTRVVQRGRQRQ